MNLCYLEEHTSCSNYISNSPSGFKLLTFKKGEQISDNEHIDDYCNLIVFVLQGEIAFSCNQFTDRKFGCAEFVFIPRTIVASGKALKNSKLIVLLFDYTLTNLCDKYTLSQCAASRDEINYDFCGLKFRSPLTEFLQLMEIYLSAGVNCSHLHEIKQKELLIILRTAYSRSEVTTLFYPVLGDEIDFKTLVLAHYKNGYAVKEMASAMAMSERSFSRRFKNDFHITYHQWMLKQKAQQMKYKFKSPNVTIKDIMYEFNFANFSHLNRFCKEHFGYPPSELMVLLRSHQIIK